MNTSTIAVNWHDDNQPVYLACFQPGCKEKSPRLATGGGDNNVRLWKLNYSKNPSQSTTIEYLTTLRKHTQAVNVVRFNRTGDILATAGDDGLLILWTLSDRIIQDFGQQDDDMKESWTVFQIHHTNSEIYDLLWSPDNHFIATGSMDNCLKIFDVSNGNKLAEITEHSHYVQGISWDPLGEFITSLSADRSLHVYSLKRGSQGSTEPLKAELYNKVSRIEVPILPDTLKPNENSVRSLSIYHTESLQSFFRRLAFSPDGSLLLTPLGIFRKQDNKEEEDSQDSFTNTVYVYLRAGLKQSPVCHLPTPGKAAVAIAFSPILYEVDKTVSGAPFKLPYKMVFAVATQNAVAIYDTQQLQPLGVSTNLHYSTISDIAWETDGQNLIVTSTDGFCSCINFDEGVFGRVYDLLLQDQKQQQPTHHGTIVETIGTPVESNEHDKQHQITRQDDNDISTQKPNEPKPSKKDSSKADQEKAYQDTPEVVMVESGNTSVESKESKSIILEENNEKPLQSENPEYEQINAQLDKALEASYPKDTVPNEKNIVNDSSEQKKPSPLESLIAQFQATAFEDFGNQEEKNKRIKLS